MAKDSATSASDEPALEVDLRDPRLAAFLAWLVPGLGHLYQRRTGKGILFFVCIVGTFVYGLYIGRGHVVYAATTNVASREFLDRWQYICQVGVGLPALPALVQTYRDESRKPALHFPLVGDVMRPPAKQGDFTTTVGTDTVRHPDELAKWNHDLADMFEMGTVFTVIAGLLNLLAIFDAHGGPLVIPPPEDKKKKRPGADDEATADDKGGS